MIYRYGPIGLSGRWRTAFVATKNLLTNVMCRVETKLIFHSLKISLDMHDKS